MAFTEPTKPAAAAPPAEQPYNRRPVVVSVTRDARDLPISSAVIWDTVSLLNGALQALEQGQFNQASLLLDAMMGDSHIAAKLDDRLAGLFGAPFAMKPPVGLEEDARALEIAEEAEELWPHATADSAERAVARDGIMLGFGLGEVIVHPGDGEWNVTLKHWHARHAYWRWDTRSYWITSMRGAEEIRPDGVGGYYSVWRDSAGIDQVSRWLVYTPYGYQRGWVNGRIKAVSVAWLLRRWAFRDWGRHSEVLGIPPKKVKVPSEWDDETKQRALRELTMLASEGAILLPQKADGTGFDVELMELKGPSAADTFDRLIDRAEASITVAIVGQTLTTQMSQSGGSRAAGQVHERVQDKILRSDAKGVSRAVRACVLAPWADWNFGDAELAPVPTWDVEPPADLKAQGEGLKALGDGMRSLIDLGVPLDRAKIVADAAVPVEAGKEFTDQMPGAGDPAAPAADGAAVVQDTALNGAQVQAMQAIVQAVADGQLPAKAARAMMRAAFPNVTDETLSEMLDGLEAFEPEKPEPPAGAPPPPGAKPAPGAQPPEDDDAAALSRVATARSGRAAAQGQTYADELADYGREFAARILAGDVKALMQVLDRARRSEAGGIDLEALRKALLKAYQGMQPSQLARLTEKCLILAELSGRYAVQKEL